MPEKQLENFENNVQNWEQKNTQENLNSMLSEMKKWNVSKEKIEHIVNYVLNLAKIESKYSEQKEQIKNDVKSFIENSVKNTLNPALKKYNVSKYDVDWQEWIDEVEEENYSKDLWESIRQIIILWWLDTFSKIHYESNSKEWYIKSLANIINLQKYFSGENQDKHFMESIIQKYWMISETDLKKMQEKPFDIMSKESRWDLAILIFKEFWDGTEDVLRFLWNIPSGIILSGNYFSYRADTKSDNPQTKVEAEIKLKELIEENPSLWLLEIFWEKLLEMLKHLWEMFTSWKQWDIATALVTIAWLIAWWAGATKLWLNMTRKSAVNRARQAWKDARVAWETVSKTTRTALKTWVQKVWKIEDTTKRIDDIVWWAGIGHITWAIVKERIKWEMTPQEKIDLQKTLDENLELREKVNNVLIRQNAFEINKYIDELVEKTDIKSVPEKELIQKRAKEIIQEIVNNPNISPESLKILKDIRKDIFTNLSSWTWLRSLTHILESLETSIKIPKNKKVETLLQEKFWNISESEFYTTVTIFHDLVKNSLPTSVVQYIEKDIIGKLSIVKWWQLSSHQLESANFLRSHMDKKDSTIYKSIEEFLEKKGIPKEKTSEYIEFLSKTIEWHGWNTEFIQHDSSKAIINILDSIDKVAKENWIDILIDDMINKWFFTQKSAQDVLIQIRQIQGKNWLSQKSDLLKKVLVKEFIKNNIWREIDIKDINLDELYKMNSTLNNSIKINDISNYLNESWLVDIETMVQQKSDLLSDNRTLLNKYLHTVNSWTIPEETARFNFNLNDIIGYANPSSEGFTKLIMFNDIDTLISSPLNSSMALLSEIKLNILNETDLIYRQKLEKMYNIWIANIQILKENYNKKLTQKLPQNTPDYIQELWWDTFWETYKEAIKLIKTNVITPWSDRHNKILQYFKIEFQEMCKASETKNLFD